MTCTTRKRSQEKFLKFLKGKKKKYQSVGISRQVNALSHIAWLLHIYYEATSVMWGNLFKSQMAVMPDLLQF